MAIIASDTGGGRDFEPIEEGGHAAVCDMMVDLGMQDGGKWGPKHQVYIRFQVPDHRIEFEKDGEEVNLPGVVGVTYTLSLSEKANLRPALESWRGKKFTAEELRAFDITKVAGKPAYLNILHEEKQKAGKMVTYANIASIMPLPKGMEVPQVEGDNGVIIYDDDHLDNYDKLPKWLQEKIDGQVDDRADEVPMPAPRTQQRQRPQPAAFDTDLDDDVPF